MNLLVPVILVALILSAVAWHLYREHVVQRRAPSSAGRPTDNVP